MPDLTLLAVAVGLVLFAGLFAAADAAITVVSPARCAELVRAGARGGQSLHAVAMDKPYYQNLLMLLRLAAELTATALVALVTFDTWSLGWKAAAVTAASMTVVSFVLVGVGPRTLGRQHAYPVAQTAAPVVRWLGRALGPLARLLIIVGNAVTPGQGFREGPFSTQTELREMVDLAEERGTVDHDERTMIYSVIELGDTIAREVMVPRTDMVWIESRKALRQAMQLAIRSGFSRIPVIGESVDDVLGVIYLKDIIRRLDRPELPVSELMRPAEFVPESKPVDDLLREMQAARNHLAIVVDEYGGTAGLVTIEDILEEIVGEITDEYDVERPPVEQLDHGRIRVSSRLSTEDLGELFGIEIAAEDVETVGGLLAQALGRVPIPGAQAVVAGLELTAEGTAGRRNRIDTVLVHQVPVGESEDD
ncbi:CNNM domain-containing protein [Longispora albida]|uniref:hemolysin family protein n=1 Tax=Longispora albida TaxID=203523 RepID=UPI00037B3F90